MAVKSLLSLTTLLLRSWAVLGQPNPNDLVSHDAGTPPSETDRYIVQFSQAGSAKYRKRDGSLDTVGFFSTLEETGETAEPIISFQSDIFHGVSLDLSDATKETIANIQSLPEVENIWPARLFDLAPVGEPQVYADTLSGWNPHNSTKVGDMHALGYFGKNVTVGIVDTGVDYTHPDLGGGFGPGFKVVGGYDFVGNDYIVGGALNPDDDPMDCFGHGTHVAGIIASDNQYIPGVAPGVSIRSYKVFGCGDGTYEDTIIAGFLLAYEEGVDIINASLGSDRGFPYTALATAVTAVQAAGVFVAFAAGNSGAQGGFYTSSGANGRGITAIGSVQHEDFVAFAVTAHSSSGESREIPYLSSDMIQWALNGTAPAFSYPDPRNVDICSIVSRNGGPSGSVMVVNRGSCGWQLSDSNVMGKTDWVFIVNTEGVRMELPNRSLYNPESQAKGFALIRYEDGDWLFNVTEQGYTLSFEFVNDHRPVALPRSPATAGRINQFTSMGPTLDGRMKPEISAPGGGIMSTWPVAKGSYATYSGTSMASPYIAGVAALFFGSRGGRAAIGDDAAALAHRRIVTSGSPVLNWDGTDLPASVAHQGSGLVDASKVVLYTTLVYPQNINLNDTAHFKGTHDIEVTNSGTEAVTYQIFHEAGSTMHTKGSYPASTWVSADPPLSIGGDDVATADLSTTEITLGPGESQTFSVTITEPSSTELDGGMLPVYGGAVILSGSNSEVVRVTYMGIKGSLYDANIWEINRGIPLMLNGISGEIVDGQNYTFEAGSVVPQPFYNILWATEEFSFDFVTRDWQPSDWSYPPVAGQNNFRGHLMTKPQGFSDTVTSYPVRNYPRYTGGIYANPQGFFTSGEKIPNGEYRIMARALRNYGDRNNINDWQVKVSSWFRITRDIPSNITTTSATVAPTSTSAVPTTSLGPEPCSTTSTPYNLKAVISNDNATYDLFASSDFLTIDLSATRSPLTFALTDDGQIRARTAGSRTDLYFSVHTNDNSLVYLYTPSRISGAWSDLQCSVVEGNLHCESNGKQAFYICSTSNNQGIIRHGLAPLDECTSITILAEPTTDPNCVAATTTSLSPTSTSIYTTATSVSTTTSAYTTSSYIPTTMSTSAVPSRPKKV